MCAKTCQSCLKQMLRCTGESWCVRCHCSRSFHLAIWDVCGESLKKSRRSSKLLPEPALVCRGNSNEFCTCVQNNEYRPMKLFVVSKLPWKRIKPSPCSCPEHRFSTISGRMSPSQQLKPEKVCSFPEDDAFVRCIRLTPNSS